MGTPQSPRKRLPFDDRNERDFSDLTSKIREALIKIRLDDSVGATEMSLAKIAGCSRATLANRKWPLKELRAIKAARKAKRKSKSKYPPDIATLIAQCKGFEEQLRLNRDELLRWKMECDERDTRIQRLEHVNSTLLKQKNHLEKLLKRGSPNRGGNVVSIRFKS